MRRRQILTALPGLTAAGALLSAKPAPAQTPLADLLLLETRIAGSHHYQFAKLRQRLAPGQTLQLIREVDNRHDHRAVALHWHGRALGYLPRSDNVVIAQLLDRGLPLRAEILDFDDPAKFWEPMTLRVWLPLKPPA
jgi:hypothetical protein